MAKDILLEIEGDLKVVNGDFVVDESIDQEVALILQSSKGEYKENPAFGLDLIKKINSNIEEVELNQLIKTELKKDGKSYQELKERIELRTNETN